MIEPYFETKLGKLYQGDCLEIIPQISQGIDMIFTDPPYSSGGQFRSDRIQNTITKYIQSDSEITYKNDFAGDNRDQRSFLAWASMWMSKCFSISNDGAIFLCFTDWRQLPTMTDAVQCGGWIWRNIVTWWKPGIRMQRGRFSMSAEYLLYSSKGKPTEKGDSLQNVISCAPVPGDDKSHIAEKPLWLLCSLLCIAPQKAIILDPFIGSGSTAIACERSNRPWFGIEISEIDCETAKKRILSETRQIPMFQGVDN